MADITYLAYPSGGDAYNFYKHTTQCITEYNRIENKIAHDIDDTTDVEDEYIQNFCVYLAHALIKDHGDGQLARRELCKVADIINVVCKED